MYLARIKKKRPHLRRSKMANLLCKNFFLRIKYTYDKMGFLRSVFLFRWALDLPFALVAFGGKTCDGLNVLGLFSVWGLRMSVEKLCLKKTVSVGKPEVRMRTYPEILVCGFLPFPCHG